MVAEFGNSAGVAHEAANRDSSSRGKPRWNPPWLVWTFIVFAILLILTVRSIDVTGDHAMDNVISATAAFLALFVWMSWFGIYSQHAIWVRMLPFGMFVFS